MALPSPHIASSEYILDFDSGSSRLRTSVPSSTPGTAANSLLKSPARRKTSVSAARTRGSGDHATALMKSAALTPFNWWSRPY